MHKSVKTIVMPVTLDTKGEEARFVKNEIEKRGHRTIIIDVGVLGKPRIKADISRARVAKAGGKSLRELVKAAKKGADRTEASSVMIEGVKKIVKELHAKGKLDGILSLGGSTGSALGTSAMSVLPVGVPKLMVSTGFELQFVGARDITMMQTPADILGLNQVMRKTLASAAAAVVGMAEVKVRGKARPMVGITALGVTTPAVMNLNPLLEKRGYEPIVFHSKTQILDELVADGRISGVIDLTTFEVMIPISFHLPEEMAEGRLAQAGERSLPQVIVPGGLDMFIFPGTRESVPEEYRERPLHTHGPDRVLVRTTADEVAVAARVLSKRANQAKGPVAMVIPLRGFSAVDRTGQHFYSPEVDSMFGRVVKENAKKNVEIVEVDAHINDKKFARAVAETFGKLVKRGGVLHGKKI